MMIRVRIEDVDFSSISLSMQPFPLLLDGGVDVGDAIAAKEPANVVNEPTYLF